MNLVDYLKDKKLAIATELYNAEVHSVDDVIATLDRIESASLEFFDDIHKCKDAISDIEYLNNMISYQDKRIEAITVFKNSKICGLIKQFIENNTEDGLNEIKNKLNESNEFGITIVNEWQPNCGKSVYGVPSGAHFRIKPLELCYPFDKFDIDDDIENNIFRRKNYKRCLKESLKAIDEFCEKYGREAFDAVETEYNKNGTENIDNIPWQFVGDIE